MTFLQPALLLGLPLVSLPIIIHLINLRRHRTVPWGAMMFLLAATRQHRGRTKLRHLLILLTRMLAVAGLVLAICRPMAGRWFGLFSSQPETVIVVLDRSASMSQQDVQTGLSKRVQAINRITEALRQTGNPPNLVLIPREDRPARLLESANDLEALPATGATDASCHLSALVQMALDYIVANKSGRTDIWICSDAQATDWNSAGAHWLALRSGFHELKQPVRFHLLKYAEPAPSNRSIRVSKLQRRRGEETDQLVLDVEIKQPLASGETESFPVSIVVDGARTIVDVEMEGTVYSLTNQTVAIDPDRPSGWGKVELPNDTNPRDNVFYFTYGDHMPGHTVIVSDEPDSAWLLSLAAAPPSAGSDATAQILTTDEAQEINWQRTALILWQAPLPQGDLGNTIGRFVADGGTILFFPCSNVDKQTLFDTSWGSWTELSPGGESSPERVQSVESWRNSSGLLVKSDSGSPLPVNRLVVNEFCQISGDGQVMASLLGGIPFLIRVPTNAGGVFFCATLPQQPYSNLAEEGIVFFAMIQRALQMGADRLENAQFGTIGETGTTNATHWQRVEGWPEATISSEQDRVAGIFRVEERLFARNRPMAEDSPRILTDDELADLFADLNYRIVEDSLGQSSSLVSEMWRLFIGLLLVALIAEGFLCLPDVRLRKSVPA